MIGWPAAGGGGTYAGMSGIPEEGAGIVGLPRSSWSSTEPPDTSRAAMIVSVTEVARKATARI